MSIVVQYNLFETREESERNAYEDTIKAIDNSLSKLRRKFFVERAQDKKLIDDLSSRLDVLEKYICQL